MANKETRVSKSNTFEEFRQKTNEVSLHLGDNEQLSGNLSNKTYNFANTSAGNSLFTGLDDASKSVRFEISPAHTLDNTSGYVILKDSPVIPSLFIPNAIIYQGPLGTPTWSGTITTVSSERILVRNTSGEFSSASDLNVSIESISNANIVRIIAEAYPVGIVRVYKNGIELFQDLSANGFHVVNHSGTIALTNSPNVSEFVEGSIVYQNSTSLSTQASIESSSNWYGVVLKSSPTQLLLKSWSNVNSSFSGTAQIRILGEVDTIAAIDHGALTAVDVSFGSTISLNTDTALNDDIKIFSMDIVASINELQSDIGVTENLNTTATNLVSAINEHDAELGLITDTAMGTVATTVSGAIREHEDQIGNADITSIDSGSDTITGALNQLHTEVGTLVLPTGLGANLTTAVNALNDDLVTAGSLTTLNTEAKYVVGAINEHELQIGNVDITSISTVNDTITGALAQLHTEVGTLSLNTTATNLTAAINELESDLFNAQGDDKRTLASLTTVDKTSIVDAINELDGLQGNVAMGTTAETITGAVKEHEDQIGNMVLTNLDATDLSAAVRELETEKVYLTSATKQVLTSQFDFKGNSNFIDDGSAGTNAFTFGSGTVLDISNASLLLPGNASGVNIFSISFLEVDGNVETPMGFSVDRDHVTTITDKADVRIQWDENYADGTNATRPARAWRLQGLNDTFDSHTTDIVTFYNAKDLITNNTESGINVSWDSTNQNFDFNVDDFTVTLGTGPISGSFAITNLASTTFHTTLNADSVTLGTHTVGSYVATIAGTANEIEVSGSGSETAAVIIGLPNAVDIGDLDVTDTTQASSSTTGALTVAGGAGIAKDLYVGGNLFVQGDQTILNTETLTIEDTLVLAGNGLISEPVSGGFGLEVGPITNPGGVAANVTGAHSIVYNYGTDRWEADGSLILSEATLGSPTIEGISFSPSKNLDFIAGGGLSTSAALVGSNINITFTNTDRGSSQNIFKNITSNTGTTAANTNNDTLNLLGGTAITSSISGDTVTFTHLNYGSAGTYGQQGIEDGTYIKSIAVNAQGHVTAITSDDFDDRYISEFTVQDGDGTSYTVTPGDTLQIASGSGIVSNFTADDVLTISHANTSSVANLSVNNSNNTFIQDIAFTFDTFGHVTGATQTSAAVVIGNGTQTIAAGTDLATGGSFTANQSGNSTVTINHGTIGRSNSSTAQSPGHGSTFTVVDSITSSATGHITAVNTKTITLPADNNTIPNNGILYLASGTGLSGSGSFTADQAGNTSVTFANTDKGSTQNIWKNIGFGASGSSGTKTANINNDTLYLLQGGGISITDGGGDIIYISHTDTSGQSSINNSGRTYIQDITLDGYGHITSISSATETVTDTTYSAGTGMSLSGTTFNCTVTDTNTTYTASSGLTLSGTAFSVNLDQRNIITKMGRTAAGQMSIDANNTGYIDYFGTGTTLEFRMTAGGDFHADGDVIAYSTTTASDAKLKTNIKTVENALDKVCQLDGVTFEWIRDGKESAGVIAQNVETVLPRAVKEVEDLNGDDTHKVVDYNQLSALFIEAIKELKDENKELRAMIEELKHINNN